MIIPLYPLTLTPYTPTIALSTLFTQIGKIGGIINAINTTRGTTVPTKVDTLVGLFTGDIETIDGIYADLASYHTSPASYLTTLQRLASSIVVESANAPTPLPNRSLGTALAEVIRQMQVGMKTVSASTVTASVASNVANAGNPVFVTSTKGRGGLSQENALAETLTGTCVADAVTGGAIAGQETITFYGQPAASLLDSTFPLGSGATVSIPCVSADADQEGGTSNYLSNSNFETFTTANIPDDWHVFAGTVGTTIKQSTSTYYQGTSSLSFVGNGSESTSVYQEFSTDTSVVLYPYSILAVNAFVKLSSVPAAGVLEISLVDSTGAVLNDAQGVANRVTQDLTSIGTGWTAVNSVFRTGRVLPSSVRLCIRLVTPLSSGSTIYVDSVAASDMTRLYTQGPYVAAFSGSTNLIAGDSFTMSVTNNRAGEIQTLFDRLFNMRGLELLLPSTTGTPTYLDSLIS